MSRPTLDVSQEGRGGGMTYREGEHTHSLSWEFALDPAIVLIFGTRREHWDRQYPWAVGRQEEIYAFIGEEVVRREVPGGDFELDLAGGVITILRARRARAGGGGRERGDEVERYGAEYGVALARDEPRASRPPSPPDSAAWRRFTDSIVTATLGSEPALGYDLQAIARFTDAERADAVGLLSRRGEVGWREVQALDALATPDATAMLREGLRHHLSIRTRLAAAAALRRRDELTEIEGFLAEQIRALHDPRDGLPEALELAEAHPSDVVKQALLYASYNRTDCAPACARLLLRFGGAPPATAAERDAEDRMLGELGVHNSSFTRRAAFDALCARLGMTLET